MTPDEIRQRAVAIIEKLVEHGRWFPHAIELRGVNGEELCAEADSILDAVEENPNASAREMMLARLALKEETAKIESSLGSLGALDPVANLACSKRAYDVLRAAGVHVVGDLTLLGPADLLAYPQCGRATLDEIVALLAARGLSLDNARSL